MVTEASVAESAADQLAGGMQPEGFEVVTLRSTQPDGTVLEWCVWHADTSAQRARGLMEVTDLGGPIGMAFTYDQLSSGSYYMYRTPMPLSIAWFGPDGQFVGTSDMAPCTETDSGDCARYAPDAEFTLAVEVPVGELAMHGLTARSTAQVVDSPCP